MNTVRLPHHRYHLTPAGWMALAVLAFWCIVLTLIAVLR